MKGLIVVMVLKKVGIKVFVIIMTLILAVVAVILVTLMSSTKALVDGMQIRQSQTANEAFAYTLHALQEQALERAEMIAGTGDIVNAIQEGNMEALKSALQNLATGMDLITLCDENGTVLARTHNEKTGDSVITQKAISTALETGKGISTVEPGTVIGLSTRGSAAIKDRSGRIIGALTCGHDLSQSKYVDKVKEQYNCEVTFFAGDTRLSTTLLTDDGNRAVGLKADENVVNTVINGKSTHSGRMNLFNSQYAAYYSPLIIDNQVVGMLFTGVNIEESVNQESNMLVMITISGLMLLLAVLITIYIINSTSEKAYWYETILDSIPFPISVTDMNMKWTFINKPVEQMLNVNRVDIRGKHCSNWGAGICNTDNCGVNCLKKGLNITHFEQDGASFQVDIHYLTNRKGRKVGHVEVVQDITKTVETQRSQTELVEKIHSVSSAFVQVSRQIASGSQVLAQSSTEQSASVEQLNATISDVSEKTKANANMAERAAQLAHTIKDNAEKGTRQMDEMMNAVRDINQASQSISKVIKAIDDIAFQTNILALNAAVEAARAGQHGKGFAVVAEEVRNLAAKSAEAAKDTSSLIADSISKAELGSAIAGDTAVSLDEIVTGINESNRLISDIANSSNEQSVSIIQINKGIEQVSEAVHLNSATAQESAAAATELTDQSSTLELLLNEFDMKHGLSSGGLPSPNHQLID